MDRWEPCLECQVTGGVVALATSSYFAYYARYGIPKHRRFLATLSAGAGLFSVYYGAYVPLFSEEFQQLRAKERAEMTRARDTRRKEKDN